MIEATTELRWVHSELLLQLSVTIVVLFRTPFARLVGEAPRKVPGCRSRPIEGLVPDPLRDVDAISAFLQRSVPDFACGGLPPPGLERLSTAFDPDGVVKVVDGA